MNGIGGSNGINNYSNVMLNSAVGDIDDSEVKVSTETPKTGKYSDDDAYDYRWNKKDPAMGGSKLVDPNYYKNQGAFKAPESFGKGDLQGYDVNVDGTSTKVNTVGGNAVSDFISGVGITSQDDIIGERPIGLGGASDFAYSDYEKLYRGASIDNQGFGASWRNGSYQIDGRYNYLSDGDGKWASKMGDQAGSIMVAGRGIIEGDWGQAGLGLSLGTGGDFSSVFLGLGGFASNSLYEGQWLGNHLRFSANADSKFSIPISSNGSGFLTNMTASTLVSSRFEAHPVDGFNVGIGYSANVDYAHTINNLNSGINSLAVDQFVELGLNFKSSIEDGIFDFPINVGANVYIPLTINDDNFSDKLSWNLQGSIGTKQTLGLTASVTGNSSVFIDKVSVGASIAGITTTFDVKNIGTENVSKGFSIKADLTTLLWENYYGHHTN